VNEIVPRDHLLERAIEVARKINENGPLAIRKIKELNASSNYCWPFGRRPERSAALMA
jgi:enoyl-CoA hydratase/carnithine racemase